MGILFANDASSTLQASITTSSSQIVIAAPDAGLFPSPAGGSYFIVTVVDAGGNMEIMKCTARTGATLTVTRGQEGTAAFAFAVGAVVDLRLTKGTMEALTQVTGESLPTHTHTASQITDLSATTVPFTPVGNIASTTVQAALAELDSEKVANTALTASNVAFTPTGALAAANVQGAIAELDAEKAPLNGTGANGAWHITSDFVSGLQQQNIINGGQLPLVMQAGDFTFNGSFMANSAGSGDAALAGISFVVQAAYGVKLGVRADGYFGLGGMSSVAWRWYSDPSGNMTAAGNITAYSDERKKRDWLDLGPRFVDRLARVRMGTYTRTDNGMRQVGVSAQSLQDILPEAVMTGEDGEYLTVAYGNAALASAVALARALCELRDDLAALREELTAIKAQGDRT